MTIGDAHGAIGKRVPASVDVAELERIEDVVELGLGDAARDDSHHGSLGRLGFRRLTRRTESKTEQAHNKKQSVDQTGD